MRLFATYLPPCVRTAGDFTPSLHSFISADKESYLYGRFQQACAINDSPIFLPYIGEYKMAMRAREHSTTAATVALSRKIARLAFALKRDQVQYRMT